MGLFETLQFKKRTSIFFNEMNRGQFASDGENYYLIQVKYRKHVHHCANVTGKKESSVV